MTAVLNHFSGDACKNYIMKPLKVPFAPQLPDEYNTLIGRIVVGYAFFEMRLQELVFTALGIDEKRGRLAVKSLRAGEMAELAVELARLDGISFAEIDGKAIRELESRRNLLAHGVWLRDGEAYMLRDLAGSMKVGGKRVQKKVQPAGIPITLDALASLSETIQRATQDTQSAILALQALRASSQRTHRAPQ